MSRGRRYEEGKLNYAKVLAVIIAFAVIIMSIIMINKLIHRGNEEVKTEKVAKNYYAVFSENKWGIIDSNATTVIEPMYQEMIIVLNNQKDVFLCTYDINEQTGEYKTKIVNKDNKEIYTGYAQIQPLENSDSSGNLWYEEDIFKFKKDEKYGLIDIEGKEILKPEYEEISVIKGLKNSILIKKDGKYGLVNTKGAIIINPEYKKIEKLDDDSTHGYIVVNGENKYGLVSYAGTKILDNKFEKINPIYGENYFSVEEGGKQKIINTKDETILDDGFDKVEQICTSGVVIVKDEKYGFLDYEENEKIKPQYEDLKECSKDIFIAKKDGKYGIIDIENKEKIKFEYNEIYYDKSATLYMAEKENYETDIINSEFQIALSGVLSEINKDKGYLKIKIEDQYKYYNFKFEEKKVSEVLTGNNLFVNKKDGKYGYIDKDGNVVVDYIYDDACEQNAYGYAAVKQGNVWGSIDDKGKIVITPKYNLDDYLKVDFIGKWHLGQDLNINYYCEK